MRMTQALLALLALAALTVIAVDTGGKAIHAEAGERPLEGYLAIQEALANDTLEGVEAQGRRLHTAARAAAAAADPCCREALEALSKAGEAIAAAAHAGTMELTRRAFGDASRAALAYVTSARVAGADLGALVIFECSMAKPYGKWLQAAEPLANPYYGARMLRCGDKVERVGGGGAEAKPDGHGDHEDGGHGGGGCC